jgi:DNA-binding MarR family transcriptional regulator
MGRKSSIAAAPTATTKQATVIQLLRRKEGASLEEIAQVTEWQPHTVRAALTGLRKKGHNLTKDKRGAETRYRILGESNL